MVDRTRKDGKEKRKQDRDQPPFQPVDVLPVLIDPMPDAVSTPAPAPDLAPSWDSGFGGGDAGGGGGGGDF
jgi:hypothetical protein